MKRSIKEEAQRIVEVAKARRAVLNSTAEAGEKKAALEDLVETLGGKEGAGLLGVIGSRSFFLVCRIAAGEEPE